MSLMTSNEKSSSMMTIIPYEGKTLEWVDFRERFEAIMAILGMKDVLKMDSEQPEEATAKKLWDDHSEALYSRLILCTKGTPQGLVKKFRTGKNGVGAWRALVNKYEQKGEVRVSALHDQLINSTMPEGKDPEGYFLDMEDLQQRLKELKVDISDATLKAVVTAKLPRSYEPLRAVLDTMKDLSYDDLKDHVRAFYDRKVAADATEDMDRELGYYANGTRKFHGKCFNCGTIGHKAPDCRKPKMKCVKCGRLGHVAQHCHRDEKNEDSSAYAGYVVSF